VFADFTDLNIVASDSVTGTLTLRLKDVPWDQALDIILQARSLGMRRSGNVLWIAPRDEISAKEKLQFEAEQAIENLEPLRTQSFQLNYAKAVAVAQGLAGHNAAAGGSGAAVSTARILSSRGSVLAEARTNQLFVTDVSARLAQVAELIGKLDVPVRQVLIEARIVEATDSFGKSLGVKLGGGIAGAAAGAINGRRVYGNLGAMPVVTPGTDGAPASALTTFTNSNFVNLPSLGVFNNGNAPGTFAVSLFSAGLSHLLNLEISALEADGKGQVVSSPRVVTADQTKALIEQGTELPYQIATSSGATSIAFRKANLKLEVTPQITPEGNIILALDVNKDSVGQATTAGFAINTKHVQTEVLVENGGTVVIGGIFELTESNDESRVPVLGEVPWLGALFRTRSRVASKTEMLVFITPRMIAGSAAP
jgi:type IV pilus assembly protein PilQ